jgi:TonB-linked SusC/RagA family outer membrane protein
MKKVLLLFAFLCFIGMQVFAQRTVTGTVTSADDGMGLPGVSVLVKGTNVRTVTDVNGAYSISAPADATAIIFEFMGMETQEVAISGDVVNAVLKSTDIAIDDVVVTAIGIKRSAKSLGYSVSTVNTESISGTAEPDLLRSIQGKVPGVDIKVGQGAPGSASRINIRGISSFYGGNEPLIVVDGVPYSNDQVTTSNQASGNGGAYSSGLSTLDPNNIESMTVLKGSAAASLYGSRASNGVIVIKTKSGKSNNARKGLEVTLVTSYATEKISNLPDYQNTYGNGSNFQFSNANGSWGSRFDSQDSIPVWAPYLAAYPELFPASGNMKYQAYPNNVKDLFRTGVIKENSLSIAGGDDKNTFSATASMLDQDGYIPDSKFQRYSIGVGGTSKLTNGLRASGNMSYSTNKQVGGVFGENQFNGAASSFARNLFLGRAWDIAGLPYEDKLGLPISTNPAQYDNPLWSWKHNQIISKTDRVVANMSLDYDITSWMNISYAFGANSVSLNRKEITDIGSIAASGKGQIVEDNYKKTELESNLLLTFARKIGDNLSIKAIIGHNVNQRYTTRHSYTGTNLIAKGIYDINNTQNQVASGGGTEERRLWALLADISIGYKDWLFLTIDGRNDWTSTLPTSSRSYFYPSFMTSFVFTEALGIKNNILNFGKVRVNYAIVGNDADPYALINTFSVGYPFLGQNTITTPNTAKNPDLKPERTAELELGAELQMFNSRLGIDFTWYNKISTDMIAPTPVPGASGYTAKYMNFGKMRNRGIELGVNINPLKLSNGLKWDIITSFTKNVNRVLELNKDVERLNVASLGIDVTPVIEPGYAYGSFRGNYALRDDAGEYIINPGTGFIYLSSDEKIVGDPNPDFILSITNNFSWKGFSLGVLWDWKKGGDIYSVTMTSLLGRGVTKDTEDREHSWIIPGVYGKPDGTLYYDANGNTIRNRTGVTTNDLYFYPGGTETTFAINAASEFEIWDATVFRLREITLGYELPKKWVEKVKMGRVNISVYGRNLWYFAPNVPTYTRFDPEINGFGSTNVQGIDLSCAPTGRRFGVNLKLTF